MQHQALEEDFYKTLASSGESLFKDRGSKFIGLAVPVAHADEAQAALQEIKARYHDARHHCFAFRTQPLQPQNRYNDDGEPSNSAGTPIFNQILAANLWNVLVVVVRYFGGTKLGVPGLINAYKTTAQEALSQAKIKTVYLQHHFEIRFPYEHTGTVMQALRQTTAQIAEEKMGQDAGYGLKVRLSQKERTLGVLKDLPFITFK